MIQFNKNSNNKYASTIKRDNSDTIYQNPQTIYEDGYVAEGFTNFMTKVFLLMFVGLTVTAVIAYLALPYIVSILISTRSMLPIYLVLGLQIAVVVFLGYKLKKGLNLISGSVLFLFYSFLTGITFSSILIAYKLNVIIHALAITALFFIALCIIGHITNYKILTYGKMLFFALVFFVVIQFISIVFFPNFVSNPLFDMIGILIFAFYTVYDFQAMKYAYTLTSSTTERNSLLIGSALTFYLNFINLFIYILRLLSKKD